MTAVRLLQAFLWFVCAFHVVVGVGINVPGEEFPRLVARYYGAERVEFTDQLLAMLKPLGAFMIILGVLAAAAAVKPVRYRAVGYGFAALFILRALQRLVFRDEFSSAFGIPVDRTMVNMVFFFLMGVALAGLQWYAERKVGVGPGARPEGAAGW